MITPSETETGNLWALCYLHDWDPPREGQEHRWEPGKNIFPAVHAFYSTWQDAEAVRRDMGASKDKYWVVRARPESEARLSKVSAYLSQPEQPALGAEPVGVPTMRKDIDSVLAALPTTKAVGAEGLREVINAPERLWLSAADADNEREVWFDPDEGGTLYIRADNAPPVSPDVAALQAENERLTAELGGALARLKLSDNAHGITAAFRDEAIARAEAAEALVADMREALEPFKREAERWSAEANEGHEFADDELLYYGGDLRLGDIRRIAVVSRLEAGSRK